MSPTMELQTVESVKALAVSFPDQARALVIKCHDDYRLVGMELQSIKAARVSIEAVWKPMQRKADEAKAEILKQRREVEAPLEEAEKIYKDKALAWDQEQERLRIVEQKRLQAIEDEKHRLAMAEAARLRKIELDAQIEAERIRQEAVEKEIEAAEAMGAKPEELQAIIATAVIDAPVYVEPEYIPAPPPQVYVPKAAPVAGMSGRDNWQAVVTDKLKLVKFVAANPGFIGLVEPNQTALNQMARAMKATMKIDGAEARNERIMNVRR